MGWGGGWWVQVVGVAAGKKREMKIQEKKNRGEGIRIKFHNKLGKTTLIAPPAASMFARGIEMHNILCVKEVVTHFM